MIKRPRYFKENEANRYSDWSSHSTFGYTRNSSHRNDPQNQFSYPSGSNNRSFTLKRRHNEDYNEQDSYNQFHREDRDNRDNRSSPYRSYYESEGLPQHFKRPRIEEGHYSSERSPREDRNSSRITHSFPGEASQNNVISFSSGQRRIEFEIEKLIQNLFHLNTKNLQNPNFKIYTDELQSLLEHHFNKFQFSQLRKIANILVKNQNSLECKSLCLYLAKCIF